MITSRFCENIVFHCNILGLKPTDKLDLMSLKEQCTKLLFSTSQSGFLVFDSYNFLAKHQEKINKARMTQKFADISTAMVSVTKRTRLKQIKNADSILMTNFFGDTNKPQTIEIVNGKFEYHTITKSEIHDAKKSGKDYKAVEGEDGVTYLFEKSYIKTVGKDNLDVDKAIAAYFVEYGNKEKYVYYIDINTEIGKNAALKNVAKMQAMKQVQAAILMNTIVLNTMITMNTMRRF